MSLTFARRRQKAEAKRRESLNAKDSTEKKSGPLDTKPEQKGESKKAKKNSKRQ